jgi:hypothetical protein
MKKQDKKLTKSIDSLIFTRKCLHEDSRYLFEATFLCNSHECTDRYLNSICIDFWDKKKDKKDSWDNLNFILSVYKNREESMKTVRNDKIMNREGVKIFRKFIKALIKIGWVNKQIANNL